MKKLKISLALLALASAVGLNAATAQEERAALFANLDTDKSGDLTFDEFSAAMKMRAVRMDKDKDGRATAAEVAEFMKLKETDAGVTGYMTRFDLNKDGGVTVTEVENRRRVVFKRQDANADGKLSVEELSAKSGPAAKGDKPKASAE